MKIGVILGSTRKGRRGERVATWLMSQLSHMSAAQFELLDLRDYPLPFYDEVSSPDNLPDGYAHEIATKWAAKIGELDGFILVMPEYNHGISAVLKNAIDYVYAEWIRKPVTFVSYSSGAIAGARAVEQVREVVIALEMAPMQGAIHIPTVAKTIDENGTLLQGHFNEKVVKMVDQLLWWAHALKTARENT